MSTHAMIIRNGQQMIVPVSDLRATDIVQLYGSEDHLFDVSFWEFKEQEQKSMADQGDSP